jgi:signal transduction histidine kinase
MLAYWQIARKRLFARERELETEIGLERVAHRATTEFLVGVAHELRQHPLRCSLRAEALAVAVEYRDLGPAMKVAVPDVVIVIDPYLLRQALHVLVGNAVRHGGSRVAIWATVEEGTVHLNVSDDGPALPSDIAAHAFQRYLDLAEPNHASDSRDVGLPLARILSELMGGEITHKRDPNWTHFSIRLSLAANELASPHDVVPLQAGVH